MAAANLLACVPYRFVVRFADLLSRIAASDQPLTLAVVGGGAGGVELALALAYRLRQERAKPGAVQSEQPDKVKYVHGLLSPPGGSLGGSDS